MKRLDVALVERGLCESRERAKALIEAGVVFVGTRVIKKPSEGVDDTDALRIVEDIIKYVSRGGLKLEHALKTFGMDVSGVTAADIGCSTGGFTDCLLRHGATRVYAVDVGSGQLHPSLISDPRVILMENTNARHLYKGDIAEGCSVIVMDVSFISQKLLYKNIYELLDDGGSFISLVKPQFEVGREHIGKNGIVRDTKQHQKAIEQLTASALSCGLGARGITLSPIAGGDGNLEYLMLLKKDSPASVGQNEVAAIVKEAFEKLNSK